MTHTTWTHLQLAEPTQEIDLRHFAVDASDGDIGQVRELTQETETVRLVIDIGHGIFGRAVEIPTEAVEGVDLDSRRIRLRMNKKEIKHCPTRRSATTSA